MKKLLLFLFIFSVKINSFCQNITNQEINRIAESIKGSKFEFGTYELNNFPCSLCSGGWYLHSTGDNQQATYSYKNSSFKGNLVNPYVEYFEKQDLLYLTFKWVNTSKNGGFSNAMIRYEINLSEKSSSWNTLIRFQALSTEMVAYIFLNSTQLNSMKEAFKSTKYYADFLNQKKLKELEVLRLKNIEDSTRIVLQYQELRKKQINDSILDLEKRNLFIKDSIIRSNLKLGDIFENGIIVKIDKSGHGLILSRNEQFLSATETVRALSKLKDNWRIPYVYEMQEILSLAKEDKVLSAFISDTQYNGNTFGWGNAKWWFALSEKGANLNLDNLWWVFKSSLGKDKPVKNPFLSNQSLDKIMARIRLVKNF